MAAVNLIGALGEVVAPPRPMTEDPAEPSQALTAPAGGDPRPRPPRFSILTLLVLTAIIGVIGIDWGLPAFQSWSNDDVTPGQVIRAAYYRFGAVTKYPPFAYVIPSIVYAPYLEYLSLTGGLTHATASFPHGFSDPLKALTVLIGLGRLLSVAMALGVIYFTYLAGEALLEDRRAALLAACMVAFHAEFTLFAQLGNVDMQGLFWLSAAFMCYARLLRDPRAPTARLLGILTALAFSTKDYLFFAAAGMALILAFVWIRDRRPPAVLGWGLVTFAITYALANNWVLGWSVYLDRLKWLATQADQEGIQYPATFVGHVALLYRALTHLSDNTGLPMVLSIVGGGVIAARTRPRLLFALLLPVVTFYVGAIAPLRFVFPRYILPWVLFLAPLAGLFLHRLLDDTLPYRSARRFAVAGILTWSLLLAIRTDFDFVFDARYDTERYFQSHVPVTARVEVYAPFTYLPRLREMGYTVTTVPVQQALLAPSAPEGLRERAPDVIVLSSKHLSEGWSPMHGYFKELLTGNLGYRVTVFRGPRWLTTRWVSSRAYVSRVNPTIWVLERESGTEGQGRSNGVTHTR